MSHTPLRLRRESNRTEPAEAPHDCPSCGTRTELHPEPRLQGLRICDDCAKKLGAPPARVSALAPH